MSRNLKRSEWTEYICQDLRPVIEWLEEQHQIRIVKATFDMKGVYTYIYVDGTLAMNITEEARVRFTSNPDIRVGEGWIGCARDFVSIEESVENGAGDAKKRSFIVRIKELFK